MTLSVLIIHNPVAGRRSQTRVTRLFERLSERGIEVNVKPTSRRGDARETARLVGDVDVIVAAGGDGTVNEVIDGLAARDGNLSCPAVAFLPLGTSNVLAWELALPKDPDELARLITANTRLMVHPGIANGRRFILMASTGLDARAVAAVKPTIKRVIGAGAYVVAAFTALRQPAPLYRVNVDGRDFEARTVIVTRARCYGGAFMLAPNAGLETAAFQVVMMPSYGIFSALKYGLALALGRLHRLADVTVMPGMTVEIAGPSGDPVQIDGDIATGLPLSLSVDKRAIPFIVAK